MNRIRPHSGVRTRKGPGIKPKHGKVRPGRKLAKALKSLSRYA